MQRVGIEATHRESGKHGTLSALRRQGYIPGVVYGHGMAATSVAVPVRAFERIRRTAGDSAIIDLQFPDGASMTTVVHEYQMNPIRDTYTHVDFLSIALDEKLTSKVAIRPVGTPIGLKDGGVLEHSLYELEVEALPLDIPDYIEVDVSGLGLKHSIHVGDLNLGEKVKVLTSDTVTVFSVVAPEVEEAPAPAEEAAAPAEGAAPAGAETAAPAASEETAKAAPKK
ncbi:MAG TPA: 50S ribosomal protein L25 [Candidatus Cryosericum sp.]|nr:50S ribosomal protein L25 [Candidatus Cryosericum sp.]